MPYKNISERVIYLPTTSLVMPLIILTTELRNLFGAQLSWKNSQADMLSELQKEWSISKCLACYSIYLTGLKDKCSAVMTLQTNIFISGHICHIKTFQMEAVDRNYLYILWHINVYNEQFCKVL